VSGSYSQELTYDDLGNILSNTKLGPYTYPSSRSCTSRAICTGPHAVTTAGPNRYRYDATGEMLSVRDAHGESIRTLAWNGNGLPTRINDSQAGPTTSTYNADAEQVQQITRQGTTDFLGPLVEWNLTRGYTTYVTANGALIARRQNHQTAWYTTDTRGTPRATTNSHGQVISRVDTAPFGQTTNRIGAKDEIGYAGHRTVGSTNLIDAGARDYDPQLGRMVSADTLIPNAGESQGLNRYSYAYNNPVDYTDPTGHETIDPEQQKRDAYWYYDLVTRGMAGTTSSDPADPSPPPGVSQNASNMLGATSQPAPMAPRTPTVSPVTTQATAGDGSSGASSLGGGSTNTLGAGACNGCANGQDPTALQDETGTGAPSNGGTTDDTGTAAVTGAPQPIVEEESGNIVAVLPSSSLSRGDLIRIRCGSDAGCQLAQSYPWATLYAALEPAAVDVLMFPLELAGSLGEAGAVTILGGWNVASAASGEVLPMTVVRVIKAGEKLDDIINEAKELTWTTGNEHALVKLANGERALVSGGPGGIAFENGEVLRIFGHTHPTNAMPSEADVQAVMRLGQTQQTVLHGGQVTKVRPKVWPP
jgi:RHS repeat-associated protein